jgi:predicted transcriptional regulator
MKIKEIIELTQATVYNCPDYEFEVYYTFASDLMSDVLLHGSNYGDIALLVTGLANPQVIRTAEVLDLKAILLVRGKKPSDELIRLAKENNIILLSTEFGMYKTCGELYKHDLKPLF